MFKKVTPIILITTLAACSTPIDRRQVNGSDEYIQAPVAPLLTIPEGLNQPKYSKEYDIPEVGSKADKTIIGKRLDIRPPLQVLAMAEGTHVEESADSIKVIVESIDANRDLKQEINDVLLGYLNKNNVAVRSNDYENGVIETDWIENEEVIEKNLWGNDKVYLLRQRYQFNINVKPHGRTGDVSINLIEHEEYYDQDQQDIFLSGEDKRRYTIDMLNNAVAYMSIERERAIRAARIQASLGIDVDLVDGNDTTEAYWLAQANFKQTWDRLRLVLPEMGFDIVDMDSSKGLFFVNLEESGGFWSSLWGEEQLSLQKGNYRIMLRTTDDEQQTKILLHDVANEPLPNEAIVEVYQRISALMKEDRKDR
ncbi:outer membrane protein assembly factor BamC [Shewanella aestuarii]|uniref:Outer membrane protein assembly factor BamC n=1 Tax=Shewanella aestuarii TaxID=1028752 RepID=A0A6G9QIT9_9GAMM|nr:outer membrane protein assembly factor BamC [Shewanella aestuarii]QIR14460.1 outer membrane protein assembly factor BamC [Shewanella aestuarii]